MNQQQKVDKKRSKLITFIFKSVNSARLVLLFYLNEWAHNENELLSRFIT